MRPEGRRTQIWRLLDFTELLEVSLLVSLKTLRCAKGSGSGCGAVNLRDAEDGLVHDVSKDAGKGGNEARQSMLVASRGCAKEGCYQRRRWVLMLDVGVEGE